MHSDGGFEDREDHQAPFTLREKRKRRTLNIEHPTSNVTHLARFDVRCWAFGVRCLLRAAFEAKKAPERLLELFDLADDGVEVGPVARIEFGMKQFSIGANFKRATARGDEGKRFDAFAEFKNLGRQTDGLRRVVSNDAIFDRDFGFHPVRSFPGKNSTEAGGGGQGASREAGRKSGRGFSLPRPPL